jgi:hypothetical protein
LPLHTIWQKWQREQAPFFNHQNIGSQSLQKQKEGISTFEAPSFSLLQL